MKLSLRLATLACLTPCAAAQDVLFSIDWYSPTLTTPDSASSAAITQGDILAPFPGGVATLGANAAPQIAIAHGAGGLGLAPGCVGSPAGTPCPVEVDALSLGTAQIITPNGISAGTLWFSVDEHARSWPGLGPAPNVFTENFALEGSADGFTNIEKLPPGPLPPGPLWANVAGLDGNGLYSTSGHTYPGNGLDETNPPVVPPVPLGDTLDALVMVPVSSTLGTFFSLDGSTFDPLGEVTGSGSAAANGFSAADVIVTPASGIPTVYAAAAALGLNPLLDDLDALILTENGDGVYTPSSAPYDWMSGTTDMLLFSVRRGSALIGQPDSIFGQPIEPGDILTTPLPLSFGGVSPNPGIFVAAEFLGLNTTRFSGVPGDELDALSRPLSTFKDCNGNNIEDAVEIALNLTSDLNLNGIPDGCEPAIGTPFCFCVSGAPCGNNYAPAGCENSTGLGGSIDAFGTTSVLLDDFVLTFADLPVGTFGIPFMGPSVISAVPFADGLRCVGGGLCRLPVFQVDLDGTAYTGPGIAGFTNDFLPASCWIMAGDTWHFQGWYRDLFGPCLNGSNVTNALSITFTP